MTTLSRREILQRAGLAMGAGLVLGATEGCVSKSKREAGDHPNIIFILADDLGYGDLGSYGQKVIQTPHLDQMAAEGVRFTQCYAGSTVCAPSRCCLMTGLHTGHARIRGNALVPLEPEDVTVAEVLRGAGYTTGLIGKWGLGEPDTTGVPNRQGFDYFFGYLNQGHAHNYYPAFLWKNEEKFPLEGNVESPDRPRVSIERAQYSHDLFAQDALDFVSRNAHRPFFLYLAFTIPHANNERGGADGDGMEVPDYGPYADKDWPKPEKGLAAMVTRMDRDVGRLLDRLLELGLDDNTIVFFTSDNGPHREGGVDPKFLNCSGPLRGIKRDLYEGGIRVPMIVRWPGKIPARTVSDAAWTFWDFLPTAAELVGAKAPEGLDGISAVPALFGRRWSNDRFLYWEFHEGDSKQAVRKDTWKAVRLAPGAPLELYDLAADIGETANIAAAHSDVVARMESYLAAARTPSERWPIRSAKS